MLDLAHIARVAGLVQLVCALPAAIADQGPGLPDEGLAFGQPSLTLARALQHIRGVLEQGQGVLAPDIDAFLQLLWTVPAALNDVNGASPEVVALVSQIDAIIRALIRQHELMHRQNVPGVMHGTARLLSVLQEVLRSIDRHAATFSSLASATAQFGPFRAGLDGRRPIDDCRAWLAEQTAALQAIIVEHEARVGIEAVEPLPSLQSDQEAAERSGIQIPFMFRQELVRIKVPSLATLASGAGGIVVRAFIQVGNAVERVALKVPRARASATGRQFQTLQREVKFWSNIKHPRILPYYGYCQLDGDQIALVSPLMENGNMLQYLRTNPSGDRETLIRQVAEGLQYLHCDAGIVHGDVKCENVLISNEGTALLADFGLSTAVAQASDDRTATTLRNRYTLGFAAPEIIIDEAYDLYTPGEPRSKTPASDVYAYGMFIYQAYTGKPPYPEEVPPQIIDKVIKGKHPSRSSQDSLLIQSDKLWGLCLQCWTHDAALRPTMTEVLELLNLAESPVDDT